MNTKQEDTIAFSIAKMANSKKFVKAVNELIVDNSSLEVKTNISNTHTVIVKIIPKGANNG